MENETVIGIPRKLPLQDICDNSNDEKSHEINYEDKFLCPTTNIMNNTTPREPLYFINHRGVTIMTSEFFVLDDAYVMCGQVWKLYCLKNEVKRVEVIFSQHDLAKALHIFKNTILKITTSEEAAIQFANSLSMMCKICKKCLRVSEFSIEGFSRKVRCEECRQKRYQKSRYSLRKKKLTKYMINSSFNNNINVINDINNNNNINNDNNNNFLYEGEKNLGNFENNCGSAFCDASFLLNPKFSPDYDFCNIYNNTNHTTSIQYNNNSQCINNNNFLTNTNNNLFDISDKQNIYETSIKTFISIVNSLCYCINEMKMLLETCVCKEKNVNMDNINCLMDFAKTFLNTKFFNNFEDNNYNKLNEVENFNNNQSNYNFGAHTPNYACNKINEQNMYTNKKNKIKDLNNNALNIMKNSLSYDEEKEIQMNKNEIQCNFNPSNLQNETIKGKEKENNNIDHWNHNINKKINCINLEIKNNDLITRNPDLDFYAQSSVEFFKKRKLEEKIY